MILTEANRHDVTQLLGLVDTRWACSTVLTIAAESPSHYDFAFYDALWESYSRKPSGIKMEAKRRIQILDEFAELIALKSSIGNAETFIKQRHGDVSKPTLWRWKNRVNGHPRQYWEALLAPQYEGRARVEIPRPAWDFFLSRYLSQAEPNTVVVYRETVKAADSLGWGTLPSCKTFQRRIDTDVPQDMLILGRKGKTALKESLPHLKRDFSTLQIHELWESDGRKADVSCLWWNGEVARPWIVIIRDVRTRMPLAVKVYTNNNAELVIDAFRNAVMLTGTTPKNFHLDNGTEYSNNAFTGGQKSTVRYTVQKNQPIGVLTRMGIKVQWATPYHGAAKAIESFWNVIAENVDKTFPKAYTGRDPVTRPEDWNKKHAVPIENYVARLLDAIGAWARGELGQHRGQGMNGKSPFDLYNGLMPYHEAHPATSEQLRAMRPLIFRRTLSSQRVFQLTLAGFGQIEYEPSDDLEVKRGYTYDILPDPADPQAPALIYEGARYLGEATYKAHTAYLHETAGGDIGQRRATAMKKATAGIKAVHLRANDTTLPFSTNAGLPDLPQPDVLKLPKEPPPEPRSRIIELENGDLMDTETGEITPKMQPLASAAVAQTDNAAGLEQLAAEQRRKHLPEWLNEQTG